MPIKTTKYEDWKKEEKERLTKLWGHPPLEWSDLGMGIEWIDDKEPDDLRH